MTERYMRILSERHHVSKSRRRMTMGERAAQFAPFAALVGYESAVGEAARLTTRRIELDDYEIERLNARLLLAAERKEALVSITYFVPDARKSGGAYVTVTDKIKNIDEYSGVIIMGRGDNIPISEIVNIDDAV